MDGADSPSPPSKPAYVTEILLRQVSKSEKGASEILSTTVQGFQGAIAPLLNMMLRKLPPSVAPADICIALPSAGDRLDTVPLTAPELHGLLGTLETDVKVAGPTAGTPVSPYFNIRGFSQRLPACITTKTGTTIRLHIYTTQPDKVNLISETLRGAFPCVTNTQDPQRITANGTFLVGCLPFNACLGPATMGYSSPFVLPYAVSGVDRKVPYSDASRFLTSMVEGTLNHIQAALKYAKATEEAKNTPLPDIGEYTISPARGYLNSYVIVAANKKILLNILSLITIYNILTAKNFMSAIIPPAPPTMEGPSNPHNPSVPTTLSPPPSETKFPFFFLAQQSPSLSLRDISEINSASKSKCFPLGFMLPPREYARYATNCLFPVIDPLSSLDPERRSLSSFVDLHGARLDSEVVASNMINGVAYDGFSFVTRAVNFFTGDVDVLALVESPLHKDAKGHLLSRLKDISTQSPSFKIFGPAPAYKSAASASMVGAIFSTHLSLARKLNSRLWETPPSDLEIKIHNELKAHSEPDSCPEDYSAYSRQRHPSSFADKVRVDTTTQRPSQPRHQGARGSSSASPRIPNDRQTDGGRGGGRGGRGGGEGSLPPNSPSRPPNLPPRMETTPDSVWDASAASAPSVKAAAASMPASKFAQATGGGGSDIGGGGLATDRDGLGGVSAKASTTPKRLREEMRAAGPHVGIQADFPGGGASSPSSTTPDAKEGKWAGQSESPTQIAESQPQTPGGATSSRASSPASPPASPDLLFETVRGKAFPKPSSSTTASSEPLSRGQNGPSASRNSFELLGDRDEVPDEEKKKSKETKNGSSSSAASAENTEEPE